MKGRGLQLHGSGGMKRLTGYFLASLTSFDGAQKLFNRGAENNESLQQIENSHAESIRVCARSLVYAR
jgi:hypothetical protein